MGHPLTGEDQQALLRLTISYPIQERARVRRVTQAEAFEEFGIKLDSPGGIVFPYSLPWNGSHRVTCRVREDGKVERKYKAPCGDARHLYFAPVDPRWFENKSVPLFFVEAEKSALAVLRFAEDHKFELVPIALGGCYGWRGRIGKTITPEGERTDEKGPLADLDAVHERDAYVFFDGNVETNKDVYVARERFVDTLFAKGAKQIRVINMPVTVEPGINGPDDFLGRYGDSAFFQLLFNAEVRTGPRKAASLPKGSEDLPEDCLDGRLGEICANQLSRFPRAYAWPALLANASVLIEHRAARVRTNIYAITVGESRSGKTEAGNWARSILGVPETVRISSFVGSGEQFVTKYGDAGGNPRLFDPDEGAHTLEKAMIEHASFSFLLTRGWGQDCFGMTVGKQKKSEGHLFNMHLSLYWGIVEDKFEDVFGGSSVAGFYQRILFGHGPRDFSYHYRPLPQELEGSESTVPQRVEIHPSVFEQLDQWRVEDPANAGVLEIGLRASTVCASFDHRPILRVSDLGPMRYLIDYQKKVRTLLKPNLGRTVAGKITEALLNCLRRLPDGQGITRRDLFRKANVYRLDPATASRIVNCLIDEGTIDHSPGTRLDSRLLYLRKPDFGGQSE